MTMWQDIKNQTKEIRRYLKGTMNWQSQSLGPRKAELSEEDSEVKTIQKLHILARKSRKSTKNLSLNAKKLRNRLRKAKLLRENPEEYEKRYEK